MSLREPTFRALACAFALISIWFFFGPIPQVQPARITGLRLQWESCADVVLVGDSTVAWRVQPEQIEDELHGGYRVVNYGFTGAALDNPPYLTAAEAVLDPTAAHRAVVIAVNGANVRRHAIVKMGDGFDRESRALKRALADGRAPSLTLDWHDELDLRLRPRGLCWLLWKLCPWSAEMGIGYNGELTTTQYPYDEDRLVPVASSWNDAPPPLWDDVELRDGLLHWITSLRAQGILVIAYIDREAPAVEALNSSVGFERARMTRQLEAAGAAVIDFPENLPTMNGMHLQPEAALRWSREIGKALASRLPARPPSAAQSCAWPLQSRARR